jgi:hypothetical protein
VPQPRYGLTSVLDWPLAALPDGIEDTVSGLDLGRLLAAGLRVAELLGEVGGQLGEEQRAVLPSAMGRFVIEDLRAAMRTCGRLWSESGRLPGGGTFAESGLPPGGRL